MNKVEEEKPEIMGDEYVPKDVLLSEKSVIEEVNKNLRFLYTSSGDRKMKLKLLYRSSRDGTTIHKVHKKINGKSPTFVFIRSEHGFGVCLRILHIHSMDYPFS